MLRRGAPRLGSCDDRGVLACVDADYRGDLVVAACLVFEAWDAAEPVREVVASMPATASYVPGELYRRELPGLAAALGRVDEPLEVVIVDGYVWLASGRPGLGWHVYEALGRRAAVVGVAKTPFAGNDAAIEVLRGASARPLYVTAVGLDAREAAARVRRMHGAHRMPTLLRRVDRLCRSAPAR